MQSNLLVIVFSGISISLLGIIILILPDFAKSFFNNNIECFLTVPPISVASYILVFKYHEKFTDKFPPMGDLLYTILKGTFAASIFFFLMAIFSSLLFRLYLNIKH